MIGETKVIDISNAYETVLLSAKWNAGSIAKDNLRCQELGWLYINQLYEGTLVHPTERKAFYFENRIDGKRVVAVLLDYAVLRNIKYLFKFFILYGIIKLKNIENLSIR